MVYEEGNPNPIENYKLLVKEGSVLMNFYWVKKIEDFLLPLKNSYNANQDSVRLYLALTFSLLLFSIFHPQASVTTVLFILSSFILASGSYLRPYSQESRLALFLLSYFLLALGNFLSPILPNSASYIFPMISVYKSQRKFEQDINFTHWAIMLIPELLQVQSVSSLLLSALTLYFYLNWHSNTPHPRLSKSSPGTESPMSSKLLNIENPPSPYANILQSINHSINLLQSSHSNDSILESTECLQKVLKIMQKNQNIYSPTFEQITKNMDIEDKIFLQQNTFASNFEVSSCSPVKLTIPDLKYGVDELAGILKQIGKEWNFNTIFVANCTGNEALYTCGEYVFGYYDFIKAFKINRDTLKNFLRTVEYKYNMNPYHNSCHAADVMNSFLYLCSSVVSLVPSVELFACVLACLGHDIAHPGTNNRFMVQTKHELALYYNDISVLENMHARELFLILNQVSCNIISKLGDYCVVRKVIIELILSTDMAKHFDFVATCKACEKPIKQKVENFTDRLELYKLYIKAADISHTAKSLELHEKWCKLLMEEFFSQGDKEKELNLPVSMYCDRKTTDVQKSQAGFLKNIALPLFATLHQYAQWDNIELICLQQLRRNIQYWEKRKDNGRNSTKDMTLFEYFKPKNRRVTVPRRLI